MKISKDIIDIFEEIIKNDYDNTHPTRIRPEIEYFKGILNLLNNSLYWSRYNHNISGKLLNNKHHEYIRKGYYNKLVKTIIEMYINTQDYYIFKFLSTDTSFIPNKYCTKVGRNKFYRNKKGLKLSNIVDVNGVSLSFFITEGNVNDAKIFMDTYKNMKVDTHANKYKSSNRHKQYMLADKGYDTKEIRKFITKNGYTPIIDYNKRNTKDKLKLNKLSANDIQKYNKRIKVENSYAHLKLIPKIDKCIEKTQLSYLYIVELIHSIYVFNRFLS